MVSICKDMNRTSVLSGGDELAVSEVFDRPHWVEQDVPPKVCPILTLGFSRTATTFFRSIVEDLTRGCTKMGLSL